MPITDVAPFPPSPFFDALQTQLAQGVAHADSVYPSFQSGASGGGQQGQFSDFAGRVIGTPPSGAVQQGELATLDQLQGARTPAATATASWYDQFGRLDVWESALSQWKQGVAPADAQRAQQLLDSTLQLVDQTTVQLKAEHPRLRPFADDHRLSPIVAGGKMNPNSSFPSEHAANSFAAATVLGSLMPDRAAEFMQTADEVAFARLYSNAHFPSDLVAGATLGRLAADYMLHAAQTPAAAH